MENLKVKNSHEALWLPSLRYPDMHQENSEQAPRIFVAVKKQTITIQAEDSDGGLSNLAEVEITITGVGFDFEFADFGVRY